MTVNSFEECYYYAELGYGLDVFDIFTLITYIFTGIILFIFVIFFKKNYLKIIEIIKKFKKPYYSKNLTNFLFLIIICFEIFAVFIYVLNKAESLKPFIDEYVSLTSNFNFFTNSNFNAGGFLGGTHSKYLTSGPISALGSVIGWLFTRDFTISRVLNFLWIVLLNLFLLQLLSKNKTKNIYYSVLFSFLMFLLIPWWQGLLYGLGEIASMIIFTNAIYLFSNFRRLSLALFGISIFLGKLLTALPFIGFYIIILLREKSLIKVLKDILYFFVPLIPWFLIINFKYSAGNLNNFIIDTLNFIFNDNTASGLNSTKQITYETIKESILSSEFSYWNIYEKSRLLLVPVFCMLLLLKNRLIIDIKFGYISFPIISSIMFHYLWFWIISPLKWMRYSQHFMVIVIITLFYLIIFEVLETKFDYFFCCAIIGLLIDNNKINIIFLLLILASILLIKKAKVWLPAFKLSLLFVIIFDISLSAFRNNDGTINSFKVESCNELLISDECRNDYLEYRFNE